MSALNYYLCRIKPTRVGMLAEGPTDCEAEAIAEHFAYLQQLVSDGVVLLAGRTMTTDERTFGIVLFTAATEADAAQLMQKDPAVVKGVMQGELFPFRIALWSSSGWPYHEAEV